MKASLGAKSLPRPLEWLKKSRCGEVASDQGRGPSAGHSPATVLTPCSGVAIE